MDPLSVTASAITVATVAANTCLAFAQLRSFIKNLPGRVHALNNEVSDFQIVCFQLVNVLEEKQSHNSAAAPDDLYENIRLLLKKAETKLEELQAIIKSLARHKNTVIAAAAFKKEQEHLHSIQDDINTVKVSLNIVLGTINTRDMTRIRLDVEAIHTVTLGSELNILGVREDLRLGLESNKTELETTLNSGFAQIEQKMENLLRDEAMRLGDHQQTQLAMYKNKRLVQQRKAKAASPGLASPHAKPASEGVGIRLNQFMTTCKKGCVCSCHKRTASETPSFVDRVLGRAFFKYAGLPFTTPKCDSDQCTKTQAPHIKVEYWFPLGFFWSQIVRFEAAGGMGPQLQISLLRRIPDSSPSVSFALEGNVDGLRDLFKRGLASPRDVSDTRGYSLLRWAIYGQQWKAAKYLITEGADPDYRPIKQSDNSPRNKINDYYLQGLSSGDAVDYLRPIIDIDDWVDEQNFQPIHMAATGLSATSLEEILKQDPDSINAVDALGRTALTWAAARGDHRTMMVLLAHGADPNLIDSYLGGPLSYAADRGHVKCVRLLLQAGAETDPILPGGQISGSPMNCASRNSKDPLVIKTLLDFGSDTESAGIDGKTSLIHVARTDNLDFALLFLERGANINAASATGETPLTTAISHNSHKVLQLLLDRWEEYNECPRLKGPHLINTAAQYGDLETLRILTTTDHFRLQYDKNYSLAKCIELLSERFDHNEKLRESMHNLISVIQTTDSLEKEKVDMVKERLLESGLLTHSDVVAGQYKFSEKSSASGSEADFEDAMENFHCPHDPHDYQDDDQPPPYSEAAEYHQRLDPHHAASHPDT